MPSKNGKDATANQPSRWQPTPHNYYFSPAIGGGPAFWMQAPWLYVRYGKPAHYPRRANYGKRGVWFALPDRDVVVCRADERPLSENFDEAIDLSPLTSPIFSSAHFYLFGQGSGRSPAPSKSWLHDRQYKVLADSGGAQTHMGTREWIDPGDSLEYMNLTGDYGIAVDPPLRRCDASSNANVVALGKAQGRLVQWMLRNKRADLKLLNAVKGGSLHQLYTWYQHAKTEGTVGWALPTGFALALMAGLEPKAHLHCMGWGSQYPMVPWIASKYAKLVTSDSSTWGSAFMTGNVPYPDAATGQYNYALMGGEARKHHPYLKLGRLPCSCPVCRRAGWFYVFDGSWKGDIRHLVTAHVLLTQLHQSESLNDLASMSATVDDYVLNLIKWYGGVRPDNTNKAQQKPNAEWQWDPRLCPFCGKKADIGKGSFPCCRAHSSVAEIVDGIYSIDSIASDPHSWLKLAEEDRSTGRLAKKTTKFKVTPLFDISEKLFEKRKGTHLVSASGRTDNKTWMPLVEKVGRWCDAADKQCWCTEPRLVDGKCELCGKKRRLPKKAPKKAPTKAASKRPGKPV